jgi:hypothetical protein
MLLGLGDFVPPLRRDLGFAEREIHETPMNCTKML